MAQEGRATYRTHPIEIIVPSSRSRASFSAPTSSPTAFVTRSTRGRGRLVVPATGRHPWRAICGACVVLGRAACKPAWALPASSLACSSHARNANPSPGARRWPSSRSTTCARTSSPARARSRGRRGWLRRRSWRSGSSASHGRGNRGALDHGPDPEAGRRSSPARHLRRARPDDASRAAARGRARPRSMIFQDPAREPDPDDPGRSRTIGATTTSRRNRRTRRRSSCSRRCGSRVRPSASATTHRFSGGCASA